MQHKSVKRQRKRKWHKEYSKYRIKRKSGLHMTGIVMHKQVFFRWKRYFKNVLRNNFQCNRGISKVRKYSRFNYFNYCIFFYTFHEQEREEIDKSKI